MHAQFGCRSIGGAFLIKLEDIRVDHAPNGKMGGAEGFRVPRPSPRSYLMHPKHMTGRPSLVFPYDYLILGTICCVSRR